MSAGLPSSSKAFDAEPLSLSLALCGDCRSKLNTETVELQLELLAGTGFTLREVADALATPSPPLDVPPDAVMELTPKGLAQVAAWIRGVLEESESNFEIDAALMVRGLLVERMRGATMSRPELDLLAAGVDVCFCPFVDGPHQRGVEDCTESPGGGA